MLAYHNKITTETDFFKSTNPIELIKTYGSPLYVYSEDIFRTRCRELKNLVKYPNFRLIIRSKPMAIYLC